MPPPLARALRWGAQGSILDSSRGERERLGHCVLGDRVQGLWDTWALQVGVPGTGVRRVRAAVTVLSQLGLRLQSREVGGRGYGEVSKVSCLCSCTHTSLGPQSPSLTRLCVVVFCGPHKTPVLSAKAGSEGWVVTAWGTGLPWQGSRESLGTGPAVGSVAQGSTVALWVPAPTS